MAVCWKLNTSTLVIPRWRNGGSGRISQRSWLGLSWEAGPLLAYDSGAWAAELADLDADLGYDRAQWLSDPDIYAVGDVAVYPCALTESKTWVPLAGPANRAGRLAGEHAATGRSLKMPAVAGTSIVRVFGPTRRGGPRLCSTVWFRQRPDTHGRVCRIQTDGRPGAFCAL